VSDSSPSSDEATAFVLDCPACDVRHETDRIDDAMTTGAKHREHTGHRMEWTRHAFGFEDVTHTVHVVACDTCESEWTFASAERASDWADEHEIYTDHAPDAPAKREADTLATDAESVQDVVDALAPTTPATHGVPTGLVLAECERVGIAVSEAAAALHDGLSTGALYEPQAGEVKVT